MGNLTFVDLDELEESINTVIAYGDQAHERADRWFIRAIVGLVGYALAVALMVAMALVKPVTAPVLVGRTMTIHCPSEDGGRPGCVWDAWTDGNGQGDPDGPRWLVWP